MAENIVKKCPVCQKRVNPNYAICVQTKCGPRYYCCKQHAKWRATKPAVIDLLADILGERTISHVRFKDELVDFGRAIPYVKIMNYLIADKDYIQKVIDNKIFRSDLAKWRYCFAIIRNNITNGTMSYEPSFTELGLNEENFIDLEMAEIGKGVESNPKKLKEGLDKRLEEILKEL